jgi:BirA family biotin operon repressor/biotin-[acetyl-CoA-carboxylase] ligase
LSTDWPEGVVRRVLVESDSTNAEAARIANTLTKPEWILAHRQTAARGRRGRAWLSPAGNFSATLVMRPTESADQVALRSFVAALALFDAFVAVTDRAEMFALKWPNDVLLSGGKVAGILLESLGAGQGVTHLAIGIGVNLVSAPTEAEIEPGGMQPVNLAEATGILVTPEEFLDVLAPHYARYEAQFTAHGFAPIREAWLARAAKLGETITARLPGRALTGSFDTVDAAGNLVLMTARGREAIPAAEIFF